MDREALTGSGNTPLWLQRALGWIEHIHPAILVFLILVLNKASFMINGGEEQYLAYALQHYHPDWVPGSFSLTEFPGTRILFQAITGFFVYHFGFHVTAFAGRIIAFLLAAFPLAKLFRQLNLRKVAILVILQLFLQTRQSFFADEWLFWGFEPKALAYPFLFWGLYLMLKERYLLMAAALALSTWFHMLVGGWCFIGIAILMVFRRIPLKTLLGTWLAYGLLMAPLVAYLFPLLLNSTQTDTGANLNWVYCYFRLKHHIGLFDSYAYFIQKHMTGVITAITVLILQWIFYVKIREPQIRKIAQLNIIFLTLALAFVMVAWIDKAFLGCSGGMGLKYYPFRMMGVSMLLSVLQVVWWVVSSERQKSFFRILFTLAVIASVVILGVRTWMNVRQSVTAFTPEPEKEELFRKVVEVSDPGDVFIFLKPWYGITTSFSRRTARENFVVFKFVPAGTDKLGEWFRRLKVEYEMNLRKEHIREIAGREGIQFVVAGKPLPSPGLALIWSSEKYYLYEVVTMEKDSFSF